MIEDKELGVKIAENNDEAFWTETREKCLEAITAEHRNLKINQKIIQLCEQELKKIG
jgi:hypothetical protein